MKQVNIRDTCISIMECSEIERRTIPVEEEETNSKKFPRFEKKVTKVFVCVYMYIVLRYILSSCLSTCNNNSCNMNAFFESAPG
jgi:hypothetical protein